MRACTVTAVAVALLIASSVAVANSNGGLPAKVHECIHDTPERTRRRERADKTFLPVGPKKGEASREFGAKAVGPIRIHVSTLDLNNTAKYCATSSGTAPNYQGGTIACTADGVFTEAKYDILVNKAIPRAITKLQSVISVDQLTTPITGITSSICDGDYDIPQSHISNGVSGTDYILYVSAAPTSRETLAFAGYCARAQSGRPVIGSMNFGANHLQWNETDVTVQNEIVNTIVHEVLHAFGFSNTFAASHFSSGTTAIASTTVRGGMPVDRITTTNVVAKARAYFGCNTIAGVELENEGGTGTAGSHWNRRNHLDDIMAGVGGAALSDITLAFLQDSGYYTVNYANADARTWGKNAGCSFLDSKCDTSSPFQGHYWCSDTTHPAVDYCTYDHAAIGYCNTATSTSTVPSYYQYFGASSSTVGDMQLMDFCPVVTGYGNRVCAHPTQPTTDNQRLFGNYFGTGARCVAATDDFLQSQFSGSGGGLARCVKMRCPDGNRVQLQPHGVTSWVDCPTDGSSSTITVPGYSGTVTCPVASRVCTPDLFHGTTTPGPSTTAAPGGPATTSVSAGPTVPPTPFNPNATATSASSTTAPSSTTIAPGLRVLLSASVTIRGDGFAAILLNTTARAELEDAALGSLATLLAVPRERLVITSMVSGSLIINFTLYASASAHSSTDGAAAALALATLQGTVNADATWLATLQAAYARAGGTSTLGVASVDGTIAPTATTTPAPSTTIPGSGVDGAAGASGIAAAVALFIAAAVAAL